MSVSSRINLLITYFLRLSPKITHASFSFEKLTYCTVDLICACVIRGMRAAWRRAAQNIINSHVEGVEGAGAMLSLNNSVLLIHALLQQS